jgi:hypothetical protein
MPRAAPPPGHTVGLGRSINRHQTLRVRQSALLSVVLCPPRVQTIGFWPVCLVLNDDALKMTRSLPHQRRYPEQSSTENPRPTARASGCRPWPPGHGRNPKLRSLAVCSSLPALAGSVQLPASLGVVLDHDRRPLALRGPRAWVGARCPGVTGAVPRRARPRRARSAAAPGEGQLRVQHAPVAAPPERSSPELTCVGSTSALPTLADPGTRRSSSLGVKVATF